MQKEVYRRNIDKKLQSKLENVCRTFCKGIMLRVRRNLIEEAADIEGKILMKRNSGTPAEFCRDEIADFGLGCWLIGLHMDGHFCPVQQSRPSPSTGTGPRGSIPVHSILP